MFESVDAFVDTISSGIEALAAIIVGYGALIAFYEIIVLSVLRRRQRTHFERARIDLGRLLVVGLEFEIGSDLLQLAVSPTWNRVGILAAVILIRSGLNILLERDIAQLESRIRDPQATDTARGP